MQGGANQANAAPWNVGEDFDTIVGVNSQANKRAAWFRNPDGNILHTNST